ncbi:DsbA family protein [Spongorhabdus nitratireducens]
MRTAFDFRTGILASAMTAVLAASALPALAADTASAELFQWKGQSYSLKQLEPRLQEAFYETRVKAWEQQGQVIDEALFSLYVDQLAAKDDRSVDETARELLKIDPITDEEIEEFFDSYKDKIPVPLEEIKPRIRQELETRKQLEKYEEVVEKIKQEGKFNLSLPKPEAPSYDMNLTVYPWKGAEDAPVTIVEFADYRCGYCKKATEAVKNILADYPDKLKIYHIDFPVVDRGAPEGLSTRLARGAYCARQQGNDAYWNYYNMAFKEQSSLNDDSPADLARKLKLNMDKFSKCVTSDVAKTFVVDSKELGSELGVTGTPSFFVNGKRVHSHDPEKDLRAMIDDQLK